MKRHSVSVAGVIMDEQWRALLIKAAGKRSLGGTRRRS